LPDGSRVPLRGALTSLDNDSVSQSQGRIMAKAGTAKNTTTRNVLIGGGAGFVLGKVLGRNSTVTGALGGIAGYVLAQKDKDKVKPMDVNLAPGTELGVRLDSNVSYTDEAYAATRTDYFKQ
jgi:hypothetical protein